MIGAGNVRCQALDVDQYKRTIGRRFLGGLDLNGWLVEQGWALAYRQYSVEYVPQEKEAQQHGRAMWRGAFDAPWDWRRGNRTVNAQGVAVSSINHGPPSAD
jgi:endonuclease YncB( thermonuclease family)